MSTKLHFRPYINNRLVLFPQRIDEDIAENAPVRIINAVIDSLNLENIYKLYYCCPINSIKYKNVVFGHCVFSGRVLL